MTGRGGAAMERLGGRCEQCRAARLASRVYPRTNVARCCPCSLEPHQGSPTEIDNASITADTGDRCHHHVHHETTAVCAVSSSRNLAHILFSARPVDERLRWRRRRWWWTGDTVGSAAMKTVLGCTVKNSAKKGSGALTLLWMFLFAALTITQAKSSEFPRRETAYACEGKTLQIECRDSEVIHLIRANYGRFSITICNDHGNTEWSVNCMSNKSLRVLHNRCSMNQNCSILASTTTFGDPCPNTLKYLEAHYQCVPATMTSSTVRPSPPWLITSQPSVWRSTVPTSLGASGNVNSGSVSSGNTGEKARVPSGVHHLPPPTFRPHITMPPDLKIGVIKVKNDGHSSEHEKLHKIPTETSDSSIDVMVQSSNNTKILNNDPETIKNEEENFKGFTENSQKNDDNLMVGVEDKKSVFSQTPLYEKERQHSISDVENKRHHHHNHHEILNIGVTAQPLWRHCSPQIARGLHWNWTSVDEVAVQPCPGGASGFARWRCVSSAHKLTHLQQQRRIGSLSKESGISSQIRNPLIIDTIGAETLIIGRDISTNPEFSDNLGNFMVPQQLASTDDANIPNSPLHEGQPVWISENPDLSECRTVWLNKLETRIKEGESLLSISNDLSQVTSKTLYGGDMMTTTNIIKKLAEKMSGNIQTFPDTRQREAIVTDLLLNVIKTASNLLDVTQQASWKDLSHPAQMRIVTSLLIGIEENAFLLAGAILREKTIIQPTNNILLSIRVLETRNVDTEEFPSSQAREKWSSSDDVIYLPRGALIDNSEGGLVRIVFVAFDHLEEILQPLPVPVLQMPVVNAMEEFFHADKLPGEKHLQMNSEKDNVTRVINSKVISASLGKGRHIQLSQPVKLILHHLRTENVTNPTCVFWDYTVNVWSPEGCYVEWTNYTHTGCQCTHLTNFALLMDVHSVPLSAANALALNIITLVGCSISVIALIASIIMFYCVGGTKSDRITIHKNLCVCLLIAELIFMFGIERTANRVVCGVIAALLHYFFLAAFAWMFLEGFQLYAMLVDVFEPERPRARWYYFFGYLIPLAVVGISALVDAQSYGTTENCWLRSDNYFHLSFIGPAALVILANWLILALVIYMMCRHSSVSIKTKENNKLHKIRVWLRSSMVLAILLGLTWTFGLLYINQETVVMAFIFTILNSLQGVFIFVSHCLQNEMFQKECNRLGRRHPWLSCCLQIDPMLPAGPTASTSTPNSAQQNVSGAASITTSSTKHQRYRDHVEDQCLEDVSEREHTSNISSKNQQVFVGTLQNSEQTRHLESNNVYDPRYEQESPHPHVQYIQHHHHSNNHPHNPYTDTPHYFHSSNHEYRSAREEPEYEEIDRNETLISDMSDDNSGHGERCIHHPDLGIQVGSYNLHGDSRPLISYSPGESHRYDHSPVPLDHHIPHSRYNLNRWESLDRHPDRSNYGYHTRDSCNPRTLAAVLNRENNVVCHVEPHTVTEVLYPGHGHLQRTVLPPYSDC